MKKGFIILGGEALTRYKVMKAIERNYKNPEWYDIRIGKKQKYNLDYYVRCEENTDVVLSHEIDDSEYFWHFYSHFDSGIKVEKQGYDDLFIHPDMIISFRSEVTRNLLPQGLIKQFIIIDFNEVF